MKVSVLVPTYNRKEWLIGTLNCIAAQVYRNFEVIIVDASLAEFQLKEKDISNYPFLINYIRHGVPGNVSKQRNIALKEATGDILLFLDDDVSFDEKLFLNYVALFEKGKYEAVSGLVETEKYPLGSPPIEYRDNPLFDVKEKNYQPCNFEIESYVICTANFAYLRSIYEKLGGFDENLYGSLDDVNYGFKLRKNNVKVIHHPLTKVFHFQAKLTGARSALIPGWWSYYNASYFQLTNYESNYLQFFLKCSWFLLKPSGAWLNFRNLTIRYVMFLKGYRLALRCIQH